MSGKPSASSLPESEATKGRHVRINECSDFSWSRGLWTQASHEILRVVAASLTVFVAVAVSVSITDGVRGVDVPYSISATISTVGLGDIHPTGTFARAVNILLLPFELVVIGFAISYIAAQAMTEEKSKKKSAPEMSAEGLFKLGDDDNDGKLSVSEAISIPQKLWQAIEGTNIEIILGMFFKYTVVILTGALFFFFNAEERKQFKEDHGGAEMTVVDALYFATVVANSIGYGHKMVAHSFASKIFMTFYFLVATYVVAGIIGGVAELYLEHHNSRSINLMIDSTTWVHKADLHNIGKISETDYVLFKLMQMQKVDERTLLRLARRFTELDVLKRRYLVIGQHVPSREQVAQMRERIAQEGSKKSLIQAWKEMKANLVDKEELSRRMSNVKNERAIRLFKSHVKQDDDGEIHSVTQMHDFSWSRSLWRESAVEMGRLGLMMALLYALLFYLLIMLPDKLTDDPTMGPYLMFATLTTVGFGDVAPTTQTSRGSTIFLIPFGLTMLSLVLATSEAYAKSLRPTKISPPSKADIESAALFDALDKDGDGELTLDEVLGGAHLLDLSQEAARVLFEELDTEKKGVIVKPVIRATSWWVTPPGRATSVFLKMYVTILVGALFMRFYPPEYEAQHLSWVDALYFATVASTTVGYGDVVVQTKGGRMFMCVYMVIATGVVGSALQEMMAVYIEDIVGEKIVQTLIDSTTFVHSTDIDNTGVVTEADYVTFKLQQMQKVDAEILDRLIDRFESLDVSKDGMLDVGIDIPSPAQVAKLQAEIEGTDKTMIAAWLERRDALVEEHLAEHPESSDAYEAALKVHQSRDGTRESRESRKSREAAVPVRLSSEYVAPPASQVLRMLSKDIEDEPDVERAEKKKSSTGSSSGSPAVPSKAKSTKKKTARVSKDNAPSRAFPDAPLLQKSSRGGRSPFDDGRSRSGSTEKSSRGSSKNREAQSPLGSELV